MRRRLAGLGMALTIFAFTGCKQENPPATALDPPPPESFAGKPLPGKITHTGSGTVTAIDKRAGRIEIAYEPMSPMQWTIPRMSLSIDPSLLNSIQAGDRVMFTLIETNGQYEIQDIRRQ